MEKIRYFDANQTLLRPYQTERLAYWSLQMYILALQLEQYGKQEEQ